MEKVVKKIKEPVEKYIEEKFDSPFWMTFIISWLFWNWKIWYTTFFIDSKLLFDKESILKIDYILNFYHFDNLFWGWDFIKSISHLFLLPLFSSWLIVFVVSHFIDVWFYDKSEKTKGRKIDIKIKTLDKKAEFIEAETRLRNIEETNKTQEDIWDEEYEKFKKLEFFDRFKSLIYWVDNSDTFDYKKVYNNAGDFIRYCIADKIIRVTNESDMPRLAEEEHKKILKFTEKGDYFSLRFHKEKLKQEKKKNEVRKKLADDSIN